MFLNDVRLGLVFKGSCMCFMLSLAIQLRLLLMLTAFIVFIVLWAKNDDDDDAHNSGDRWQLCFAEHVAAGNKEEISSEISI